MQLSWRNLALVTSGPQANDVHQNIAMGKQCDPSAVEFLFTLLQAALALAQVPALAELEQMDTILRNLRPVRATYRDVRRFREHLELNEAVTPQLDADLRRLRAALEDLEARLHTLLKQFQYQEPNT